jgi:hypothetical protein
MLITLFILLQQPFVQEEVEADARSWTKLGIQFIDRSEIDISQPKGSTTLAQPNMRPKVLNRKREA